MKKLLLATVAASAISFGAQAAPVGGPATFGGSTFLAAFGPGLLNVGSTVTPTGTGLTISPGTGDLSGLTAGTSLTGVSGLGALNPGAVDFNFTVTGFGAFDGTPGTSIVALSPVSTPLNRVVDLFLTGTFTPTFGGFTAAPASVTGAFTQTGGAGGAVSFSFTFASPPSPPPPVPAPAALLVLGAGLLGLGLVRARKA